MQDQKEQKRERSTAHLVRISHELYVELQKLAQADNRTVNNYIVSKLKQITDGRKK